MLQPSILVWPVGCASEGPPNEAWPCHMTSPCKGGFERVLYGWGKNAPAMSLPKGVGYSVGPGSAMQSLVLQVSYMPIDSAQCQSEKHAQLFA